MPLPFSSKVLQQTKKMLKLCQKKFSILKKVLKATKASSGTRLHA
jgi:hypothetical protein